MKTKEILEKFFPGLIDKTEYQVNPSREEQYRKIFSDKEMDEFYKIYPNSSNIIDELNTDYMGRLLKNLIQSNDMFFNLESMVSVAMINSNSDSTCCFTYNNNQIVLFDRNTMMFCWMLNKAFIYESQLDRQNQILLYVQILLFFLSQSFHLNLYPKPQTPPHSDRLSLANLSIITEIQESFMLAHEMAHIIIDKDKAIANNLKFVDEFVDMIGFKINHDVRKHICEELEADKIALDSLLNTFEKRNTIFNSVDKNKDVFTIVTSAVFLLIRYNLWLNIAENELLQLQNTYDIWFVRNSFFRKLVTNNYIWGVATYIIDILDILEDTFEPAVLIAADILKKDLMKK